MEYSFFDGRGSVLWCTPLPVVGLSHALQNSSLDCFAPSLCSGRAFESYLQKRKLSFWHGESTRGEGMPLSYKITAPEARTKKRDTQ